MFTIIMVVCVVAVVVGLIGIIISDWQIEKNDGVVAVDVELPLPKMLPKEIAYALYIEHRKIVLAAAETQMHRDMINNTDQWEMQMLLDNGDRVSPLVSAWLK